MGLWLLAFAIGVSARPGKQQLYLEYPPTAVFRGAWGRGFWACLITTAIAGWVRDESVPMSLLWAIIGFAAINLMVLWAFIGSIQGTKAGVARKGNPSLMIADAYQRVWSFYGAVLLIIFGLLFWIVGLPAESWLAAAVLHASMVMAVVAIGYASGYYP